MAPPSWTLPITMIEDNPYQARVDYGDVGDLAEQIWAAANAFRDTLGLMQVPHGRVVNASGELVTLSAWASETRSNAVYRVQLLYGHRRLRAFRHLAAAGHHQYHFMPVILIEASDEAMIDAVWGENRNRRDLTAIEEATLMQSAIRRLNCSQAELAARWGLARPTIANKLALLNTPDTIQQAVQSGRISERVAHALMPLLRLWDIVLANWKGHGNSNPAAWFVDVRNHFLPTPDAVLDYLTGDESGSVTSNQVREYVNRALNDASWYLDETISGFSAVSAEPVRHATCQGCAYRWQTRCFDKACLDAKVGQLVQPVVDEAAANLGLTASDNPDHFASWTRNTDLLKQMWQVGSCPHLVVGWYVDDIAVRPLQNTRIYMPFDARLFANLTDGIALGCTHTPAQGRQCAPTDSAIAEERKSRLLSVDPLEAMREQWEIEDAAACRVLRQTARDLALSQLLRWASRTEGHAIGTLLWLKDSERLGKGETQAAEYLFKKYWPNSAIMSRRHYHMIRHQCHELLHVLEIPTSRLDEGRDLSDVLIDQARSICLEWAENRQYEYFRPRVRAELMPFLEAIQPKITNYAGRDSRLTDMATWLDCVSTEMREAAAAK